MMAIQKILLSAVSKCVVGVWDGLDACEISRPEILSQSTPGYTYVKSMQCFWLFCIYYTSGNNYKIPFVHIRKLHKLTWTISDKYF